MSLLILGLIGSAVMAEVTTGPGPAPIPDSSLEVKTSPQPPTVVVSDAEEAQLRTRVLARWEALIKGDFGAAYQFETPAYRTVYTPNQFRVQFSNQTRWIMANIKDIRYDDSSVARVAVEVLYRYIVPDKNDVAEMNHVLNEIWLRKDDQWWRQRD
jgi:hypothetical protein